MMNVALGIWSAHWTTARRVSGEQGWVNKGMVELLVRGVTPAPDPAPSRSAPAQARARRSIQNRYPSTETAVAWSVVKDFALSDASDVSMFLGGPSVNDTSALGFNVATDGELQSLVRPDDRGWRQLLFSGRAGHRDL